MKNVSLRNTKKPIWKKVLIRIGLAISILIILVYLAFQLSPWPSVLLLKNTLPDAGPESEKALEKYVPDNIASILDQQYDLQDKDAFLDVYYPSSIKNTDQALPVIVWVHGGGWIGGSKEGIANYCKILAGKGYTVVSVGYSLAPQKHYPTPLRQLNAALGYLRANAKRLHINPSHFILAGDSGGASIAAQVGNIISNKEYAELLGITPAINRSELSGLILYCGPYDIGLIDLEGAYSFFLHSILWAYSGKKDFANDPMFKTISVVNYVDGNYPPAFISAGNGDPLESHSKALAKKLASLDVRVDTLFYPEAYLPVLPHEYQYSLDMEAGKNALEQSVQFLKSLDMERNNIE